MTQFRWWPGACALALALAVGTAWADKEKCCSESCPPGCCEAIGCPAGKCCTAGTCCTNTSKADRTKQKMASQLEQFNTLLKEGKYQEAEQCARKAHELDPENPVADAALSLAHVLCKQMGACQTAKAHEAVVRVHSVADLVTPIGPPENKDVDALTSLIAHVIQPESWNYMGGSGTLEYYPLGQALVIRQEAAVQEQIAQLLNDLRSLREPMEMMGYYAPPPMPMPAPATWAMVPPPVSPAPFGFVNNMMQSRPVPQPMTPETVPAPRWEVTTFPDRPPICYQPQPYQPVCTPNLSAPAPIPMPTLIAQCAAVQPYKEQPVKTAAQAWNLHVVTEDGKAQLEVCKGSKETSVLCESMVLKVAGGGSLRIHVAGSVIQVQGPNFTACADSLSTSEQTGRLVLQGRVRIEYQKPGLLAQVTAHRVVVGLTDGRLEVESNGEHGHTAAQKAQPAKDFSFWTGFFH
jgi:hypothetical protein